MRDPETALHRLVGLTTGMLLSITTTHRPATDLGFSWRSTRIGYRRFRSASGRRISSIPKRPRTAAPPH